MRMLGVRARWSAMVGIVAVLAAGCLPSFAGGAALTVKPVSATSVNLIWNPAFDPDVGDDILLYAIHVNSSGFNAYVLAPATNCTLVGLQPSTTYNILVTAVGSSGEWSGNIGGDFTNLGRLSANYTTPAGSPSGASLGCANPTQGAPDSDGDHLPDWAETSTGVYVNPGNTGTSPTNPDTDGDGISDGDETLGTLGGLVLPMLGAKPLRKNIFIEADWFETSYACGYTYSQQVTGAEYTRVKNAFNAAPIANPDGSTGVDLVIDYGQGGAFLGGNEVAGDGRIAGEVNNGNDSAFDAIKAANFNTSRNGYFHYLVMAAQYGGGSSSGVAELPGDDFIVSLPDCYHLNANTTGASHADEISNTIMHELGHNLYQWHAGVPGVSANYRPNYNSIMNYLFQGNGVDTNCDGVGDGVLDYSRGTRLSLNEAALNENNGVCGAGHPIDWNKNGIFSTNVAVDLDGNSVLQSYSDYDNWANIWFGGLTEADGAGIQPTWIVEQPAVPR